MCAYPSNLKINNRPKLSSSEFKNDDKLYHGYDEYDVDDFGKIKTDTIRFPDFSCNWARFSKPGDVRYRENANITDGCYSFTVQTSRYKKIANPVHDPISDKAKTNYSHVEVRQLLPDESFDFEPPRGRTLKSKRYKRERLEYRKNLQLNLIIELSVK